jgi:hypothetical protein
MESTESHGITRNQWNHMESADSAVLESFGITWNHMESMESHGINGIMESWNHRISCFPLANISLSLRVISEVRRTSITKEYA